MATLPIHTVQHVKSVYNKFQVIAVVFTAITLVAALLAAVSGFQLARLSKMHAAEAQAPPPSTVLATANDELQKQIRTLEDQLNSEKATTGELRSRIHEMEKKLASMKDATPSQAHTATANDELQKQIRTLEDQLNSEKNTSRELRSRIHEMEKKLASMRATTPSQAVPAPEKQKVLEVAPAAEAPSQAQPSAESQVVAEPPESPSSLTPEKASKPSTTSIPAEKSKPQVETTVQEPGAESSVTEMPSKGPEPSGTQTPPQPGAPAIEKNQSAPGSVSAPGPEASPENAPTPPASSESIQRDTSENTGDESRAPADQTGKSTVDSNNESQTGVGSESEDPAPHTVDKETTSPGQKGGSENP